MARKTKGNRRNIDGILLLDKPQGMTSNAALQTVRKLYNAAKGGHTGALDPLATGMLPLCFGEATKFSHYLLDADKRYLATVKLGVRTDSSDADGKILATEPIPEGLSVVQLEQLLLEHFTGEIEQVPSMFSALKHQGQPLYKLARKGIKVEVKPRKVTIFAAKVISLRQDEIDLDICCSKGTYIRSIAEDMGFLLGCGAHIKALRRLTVGHFEQDQMLTLDNLRHEIPTETDEIMLKSIQNKLDRLLLPSWEAIRDFPEVLLEPDMVSKILQGHAVPYSSIDTGIKVRLFAEDKARKFLGVAEVTAEHLLKPKRLICTN